MPVVLLALTPDSLPAFPSLHVPFTNGREDSPGGFKSSATRTMRFDRNINPRRKSVETRESARLLPVLEARRSRDGIFTTGALKSPEF